MAPRQPPGLVAQIDGMDGARPVDMERVEAVFAEDARCAEKQRRPTLHAPREPLVARVGERPRLPSQQLLTGGWGQSRA